ncbi:elongator complex protein 4 [Maniola hyperantus]|uniref:elongator complex protein 4 n=1 Tax=Aphantopus hyperantus TaxID=2795564 RepID=UPI001568C540|nr:elongator complex protein 4 isoform X2 [Maniola hyperantus]
MTSFHKASSLNASLGGTKLKNNLAYVSSGIPSLDFIIGSGLSAGSVFLVEEDLLGSYSRVLTKYFLAEGVVCKHDLFIASADENPENIVKELPQPCTVSNEKTNRDSSGEMKIAWRYEGLGQVESSFGSNTNFGHHFDLSKHIDEDTVCNCNITYCHLLQDEEKVSGFKNNLYHTLLTNIKKALSKGEYTNSSKNKNILRLSIQALGSPIWMTMDYDDTHSGYGQDLIKFMYCLRMLVRDTNAVAFVTVPSHLFDDEHLIKRILYSVDNAVRIESFAGSSKETNPVYNEYHGLFYITKLSALYTLVPFVPPSLDLAFKLRRKKFVIEKLHLPPELQESSEREQDDITAVPKTCGGFKKKDIDF